MNERNVTQLLDLDGNGTMVNAFSTHGLAVQSWIVQKQPVELMDLVNMASTWLYITVLNPPKSSKTRGQIWIVIWLLDKGSNRIRD